MLAEQVEEEETSTSSTKWKAKTERGSDEEADSVPLAWSPHLKRKAMVV